MIMEKIVALCLVFVLFFSAVLSLVFSGLSLTKAISLQNEVSVLFFQELQSKEVSAALVSSISFILNNAVLPLLPFIFLSVIGFSSIIYFKPETKYLFAVLTAVLAASVLIKFSLAIAIICLGYFPSAILLKGLEEKKTAFKTASSFTSSCLRYLNIFIALGVFLGILMMPNFEKLAEQGILSSISGLLPQDLQQAQAGLVKTFVEQNMLSAKNIVDNEYAMLGAPQQCKDFRDNVHAGLENYKTQVIAQLQNISVGQQDLSQLPQFGFLSVFTKTIPLTAAIAIFFLFELLKPLFAAFAGLIYKFAKEKV